MDTLVVKMFINLPLVFPHKGLTRLEAVYLHPTKKNNINLQKPFYKISMQFCA